MFPWKCLETWCHIESVRILSHGWRPAFTEDSWWTSLSSCRVLIAKNKTHSCILVSGEWKTNDSYILRGMYSLSKHAADFYVLECILVSGTHLCCIVSNHISCVRSFLGTCYASGPLLIINSSEYLAVCQALSWTLEMQALNHLCRFPCALVPSACCRALCLICSTARTKIL